MALNVGEVVGVAGVRLYDSNDCSGPVVESQAPLLLINSGLSAVEPSHWSFGQLAGWVKAPAEYIRRLPAQLAVDNLNHGISTQAIERGTHAQLLALDGRYAAMWRLQQERAADAVPDAGHAAAAGG